jgi:hypothetical protein
MKLLAAILVFMIAAQPVQAGFCDMQPSGDSAADTAMHQDGMPHSGMQHSGMQHSGMQYSGMQHSGAGHPSGHDCCERGNKDKAAPGTGCGHNTTCGSCSAGLSAAAVPSVEILTSWNSEYRPAMLASHVVIRHTSPPFRPPIDLS